MLGAALAIAVGLRIPDEDRLGTLYQRLLGAACLLLPVLRLATGGMDWAEALLARQTDVLTVDLLLLIAGAALLWHARGRVPTAPAAAPSWGLPSERPRDPRRASRSASPRFAYLAATDPKRRRAFRLPDPAPRRPAAGWAAVLLPGFLVPVWAGGGGFFVWLGASSVLGWTIAAASPQRTASIRQATHDLLLQVRGRLEPLLQAGRSWRTSLRRPRQPTLEQRVREPRAGGRGPQGPAGDRARDRTGTSDVVVELPRPVETARTPRSRRG